MADIHQFDNFMSVAFGLKVTVEGLQDFVANSLRTTHRDIYVKLSLGYCNVDCSRKFGRVFGRWCTVCLDWKKELHNLNRFKTHWERINWKDIDTIDFPLSSEEMAKVFVQDFKSVRQGLLQDLGALMSLFKNMKTYNAMISDQTISNVQRTRNQNFAHNYTVFLHDVEKTQSINSLITLLRVPEIRSTESSKKALADLEDLKLNQRIPERLLQQSSAEEVVTSVQLLTESSQNEIVRVFFQQRFGNMLTLRHDGTKNNDILKKRSNSKSCSLAVQLLIYIFLLASFVTLTALLLNGQFSTFDEQYEGNFFMRFEENWQSYLDFDLYVEELKNQSMVGREWLLPILESKLDQPNKGILLTADMGFGKSSIVSNIVCAKQDSVWRQLKKRVLAYHMCRYDVISSSKPDIFIKNLVGIIVKKIPELGNSILSDDRALDFLYSVRCREDPVGCLEFSLLNPLNNKWKENSYIIIIDAIDECQTAEGHSLQDLLYKKMQFFPNNVKFFITSRNIEQITHKFKMLETVSLDNYTQENLKDVRAYIDKTRKLTDKDITKLTKVSGGNFLHVKLFLNYCIQKGSCNYDYIPDTLERIYVLNFERVFREKGLFDEFLDMFAVLCSLQHPIDEDQLLDVSGIKTNAKVRARQILGNELGHFLKISDGRLSFQHKSLVDFLTNSSRRHLSFYIDIKRGHKLFAGYLLQSLNLTESNSLLEVVHHVALAKDVDFEAMLINHASDLNHGQQVISSELLLKVVSEYDSYDTVKLTIRLARINASNVNEEELSLSAFIAIANEHEGSFRACLENGANISYIHDPLFWYASGDYSYICKYIYFCKYSLLHLSAQRGYLKIAEILMEKQISLLYLNNSLGLNAFQLAAEHGHTSIMKLFLKYNSTLADFYSLHQSTLRGEFKAVKMLLDYVDDLCQPCLEFPKVPKIYRSYLQYNLTSETSQIKYQMTHRYETWSVNLNNLFICESALNAAVRNGYLDIVKLLLAKSNVTVSCPTFDGSIPLMTAVVYNQTEIFKILYEAGSNTYQRCHSFRNADLTIMVTYPLENDTFLNVSVTDFKQPCPPFAGVEHLIAIYDNLDIIHFTNEKEYHSWYSGDIDGVTPFHYAFCHNSINFMNYIILRNNFVFPLADIKSHNGSSPFHSAAICKSTALFHYLNPNKNNQYNKIPDVIDNENRSILQYAFLQPLHGEDLVKLDYIGHDAFTSSMLHVIEVSNHNALHKDIYG
ncbi:ANKRD50 [Mytilus coruscus]|uniref:ANKRD50 n=1 Tax=Mytilus coruscus TaxID=42192 RepID=A0A6J8CB02_MYTCO|nr:ANKRD50 [Mytilus coruscus]